MKFLATIREFSSILFNKPNGDDVEMRPETKSPDAQADQAVIVPDVIDNDSDTLALLNTTQTLKNKDFSSPTGTDRKVALDIDGATDSTTTTLDFNQTVNRTITFPDQDDTLATSSDLATSAGLKVSKAGDTMTGTLILSGANITMAGSETVDGRDLSADGDNLDAHLADDASSKHDADQIDYDNTTSGLPATDIQTAIDEVEARVDANDAKVSADGSVTTHSDVTDAGSGAIITATERTQITTNQTDLSTHISDTQAHGASGAVVGTLNAQTLKDKTLDALQYTSASVAILTNLPIVDDVVMKLVGSPTNIETLTFPSSPLDGTIKVLTNETGNTINLVENVGAKGFQTGTGANLPLLDNGSAIVIYDASEDRWRVIGGAGGSGGGLSLSTIAAGGAVSVNTHYLTTSGPYTITLPEGEPGAVIRFSDTDSTWHTGNITLTPDGAETIDGESELILDVQDSWVQLMWNGSEWVTDDSLDPNTADFTGDLSIFGHLTLQEQVSTPADPAIGSEGRLYIKDDKLIAQFNDGGTVRYKYLDLTGTGVTWVHTTTAP